MGFSGQEYWSRLPFPSPGNLPDPAIEPNYEGSPGCPGGSEVKNLPTMQETQESRVGSLGQEDPLEEGMAIHSSILVWRIPWMEEPGRPQSMGLQRVGHD